MTGEIINYYNNNAKEFIDRTINIDMGICQNKFMSLLKQGACILDAGCGSGRDSKFFKEHGFNVTAIDASSEMCRLASEYTGLLVECISFNEIEYNNKFDGIWACASLLHIEKNKLPELLKKFNKALKPGGVMYASFKYGNTEEKRLGRFFSDYSLDEIQKVFLQDGLFILEESFKTEDARPDYKDKPWVNIIVKKKCFNSSL